MKMFNGIYSALFSIYDENMNVKKEATHKLMKYQTDNGLKGFYVGGHTGECYTLPNKTRIQVLEAVMEEKGESEVIAHIGAGHFDDTCQLMEHANACGVDAIASLPPSLTPYYSTDSILEYYKYLAEHSKAPVIAYVNNVFKGDALDFVNRLKKIDNIIGIKLSIPDYYLFERVINIVGSDYNILNGPDEYMICGLAMGANGAIGTSYNIMPDTACAIFDNFTKGNVAEARKYQNKLNRMIDKALVYNAPAYWKAFLEVKGFDMGYTVFPATPLTKEQYDDVAEFVKGMNI